MDHFFIGFATGFVTALFSAWCWYKANINRAQNAQPADDQPGLNSVREEDTDAEERQKELKELHRQYSNMMAYTGKSQKHNGAEA